jgi:sarcosine oxidase
VRTTKGTFQCRKLIVTAGAWINNILQSIGIRIPIIVTQEQLTYVATSDVKDFTISR